MSLPPPLSVSLCFYLVLSDRIAYQHRCTGHDLSLRQQKARKRPRDRMGRQFYSADAGTFREKTLFTKGMGVQFLLLFLSLLHKELEINTHGPSVTISPTRGGF